MKLVIKGPRTGRLLHYALITLLSAGEALAAQAPAPPTGAVSAAQTESQKQAVAALKSMAEYLAGLKSFSCTSSNGYEVVQPNGQKIEFGESRRVSLARPDRLRIEEVASDGVRDLALFDGTKISVFSADDNVYAQAAQPPSIEDALVYYVRDLRMRMPLALMLSTHVRTELPAMAKEVDYVESTTVRGQKAHHIAGRSDSVDFQLWIADGPKPLPLRVVITYKLAPGQPRFWADISDWNTAPKFAASTFQLSLPRDARQIPFAVQLSALGAAPPGQAAGPAASGEVKP